MINGLTFDGATTNPMEMAVRDALIGFMAATAQAQAEATKEAQRLGIEHAKATGEGYRGRKPSYNREHHRAGYAGPEHQHHRDREGHQPQPANGLSHQGRSRRGRGCAGNVGKSGRIAVGSKATRSMLLALSCSSRTEQPRKAISPIQGKPESRTTAKLCVRVAN